MRRPFQVREMPWPVRYTRSTCSTSQTATSISPIRGVPREVQAHGGKVVALEKFRESAAGEIAPRQVFIVVEWESKAAFDSYRDDPALADLHRHRERGTTDYVWHLFDKLDDLRPILKSA